MDGLLLDSERIAYDAFRHACGRFGLGDLSEVFFRCIGTNRALGEQIVRAGLAGLADYDDFVRAWDDRYLTLTTGVPIPLKPGVTALLARLQELNLPMAVATSTVTVRAHEKLAASGILDRFQCVVGGD
jgi:beta-phosphoglucomutase-like phosphatase (HAD superfamily)